MIEAKIIDHEQERKNDIDIIKNSSYPRKVVVSGPGTGKSYLFQEVIKKKKEDGKENFLAITFMGKLCDGLADDLAGLVEAKTLHGFARKFVKDHCSGEWEYYPKMMEIIKEDLKIKGIVNSEIGDNNYKERTLYYKAVGHDDVIYYAVQICKKDKNKIPEYDLILVDEFQDFNETEAEFIDLLATKNEILIVGDDDQALYRFKGSFSKFIKDKHDKSNTNFESHTLKYCSRCTEVIINAFHNIIDHFSSKGKIKNRINDKKLIYYPPDKKEDSDLNQKLFLLKSVTSGSIPTKIKYELLSVIERQKIKSVLIIGEARTCKMLLSSIAIGLKEFGFRSVDHDRCHRRTFFSKSHVIEGYKILIKKLNDVLAWRLLLKEIGDKSEIKKIILDNYDNSKDFIEAIPEDFKNEQEKNAKTLMRILKNPESGRKQIALSSIEALLEHITMEEKEKRKIFIDQLIDDNKYITRPLADLDIVVGNILGAKGLEADVVFLVGFDQGKLPMKDNVEDSEIYQMIVALTRAKKRVYLINTVGIKVSQFIDCIDKDFIETKVY